MATNLRLPATAVRRLDTEADGWLTTVRSDGQPQSSVIWFYSDDGTVWIRSQPNVGKIANIRHQPRVAFNLNSDGHGAGVVTLEGTAELVDDLPPGVRDEYIAKYERAIRGGPWTSPEQMLADFSTTIRITVERARAW